MSTALMTLPEFARYIGIATPTLARAFCYLKHRCGTNLLPANESVHRA